MVFSFSGLCDDIRKGVLRGAAAGVKLGGASFDIIKQVSDAAVKTAKNLENQLNAAGAAGWNSECRVSLWFQLLLLLF